jgi:hypothetical protein
MRRLRGVRGSGAPLYHIRSMVAVERTSGCTMTPRFYLELFSRRVPPWKVPAAHVHAKAVSVQVGASAGEQGRGNARALGPKVIQLCSTSSSASETTLTEIVVQAAKSWAQAKQCSPEPFLKYCRQNGMDDRQVFR